MQIIFRSNLGHVVKHEAEKIRPNSYRTTSKSRLLLTVDESGVFIIGGHAVFDLRNHAWAAGAKHLFNAPISLGKIIST